jgi:L-fuculose-phosphate aldolase
MNEAKLRRQMVKASLDLIDLGLNRGASGNLSVRSGAGFLITPSGLSPEETSSADIAFMDFSGNWQGRCKPSSEWRFHRDILAARPEVSVIVHTHSMFATTLACLGQDVPAFHYMIAVAGGKDIRCTPYATFGEQALSDHAVKALQGRKACLLGNHGMIALGDSLASTIALAVETEALCEQYWRTLQIGQPNLLSDAEMDVVLEKFKHYGAHAEKS